ncbi:acylphosphatase [Rhizomicrobium palustre]|uniref:acylphosphatase n=1 Tax=Rhizomicrobium palustre TaxID=189966 RepID=A0A846N3Q6_9PROT|nr:acylphosphatase [Rhizomicrobium palustre]NIK90243.1 acylphosphatase [Rhizomicrobium palustre]
MAEEGDLTTLRVKIEGYVQSVGYRNFAMMEARRLELDGWVRNRSDGTVEILISGPNAAVETFVGLAMRGPSSARVTNVELHQAEPPADKGFRRRPSL